MLMKVYIKLGSMEISLCVVNWIGDASWSTITILGVFTWNHDLYPPSIDKKYEHFKLPPIFPNGVKLETRGWDNSYYFVLTFKYIFFIYDGQMHQKWFKLILHLLEVKREGWDLTKNVNPRLIFAPVPSHEHLDFVSLVCVFFKF